MGLTTSNDVWIFQIAQTLKLGGSVSVVLAGGAVPENVYWQVAEGVTLQAGSTFNGIALSKTEIVAKTEAIINGRALAQVDVTLVANDVNEPAP